MLSALCHILLSSAEDAWPAQQHGHRTPLLGIGTCQWSFTPTPAQDALLHQQPHQQPLEDVLIFMSMLQPCCFSRAATLEHKLNLKYAVKCFA